MGNGSSSETRPQPDLFDENGDQTGQSDEDDQNEDNRRSSGLPSILVEDDLYNLYTRLIQLRHVLLIADETNKLSEEETAILEAVGDSEIDNGLEAAWRAVAAVRSRSRTQAKGATQMQASPATGEVQGEARPPGLLSLPMLTIPRMKALAVDITQEKDEIIALQEERKSALEEALEGASNRLKALEESLEKLEGSAKSMKKLTLPVFCEMQSALLAKCYDADKDDGAHDD